MSGCDLSMRQQIVADYRNEPTCSGYFEQRNVRFWESSSNGQVPRNAFCVDDDGSDSFPAHVGVASVDDELVPGMLLPDVGVVGVTPLGKRFAEFNSFVALVGNRYSWVQYVPVWWCQIPREALNVKYLGQIPLYVGRVEIDDVFYVGMVHNATLHVLHNQEVKTFKSFQVLCV